MEGKEIPFKVSKTLWWKQVNLIPYMFTEWLGVLTFDFTSQSNKMSFKDTTHFWRDMISQSHFYSH